MFTAFTGWFAALRLKECWIQIYLTILITIFMLTLAGFIVVYFVDGENIEKIMEKSLVKNKLYDFFGEYDMTKKKNMSQEIDDFQVEVYIFLNCIPGYGDLEGFRERLVDHANLPPMEASQELIPRATGLRFEYD